MKDKTQTPNSNRYMLFAYDEYYPAGPRNDCKGTYSSQSEAITVSHVLMNIHNCFPYYDYIDLLDLNTGQWFVLVWTHENKPESWHWQACVDNNGKRA